MDTTRSLSEQHALDYATARVRGLDLALSLAAGGIEPDARRAVLDAVIRSRAVVLDQIAARHRTVSRTEDPEVARLAAELAKARSHLANLTVRGLESLDPEPTGRVLSHSSSGFSHPSCRPPGPTGCPKPDISTLQKPDICTLRLHVAGAQPWILSNLVSDTSAQAASFLSSY